MECLTVLLEYINLHGATFCDMTIYSVSCSFFLRNPSIMQEFSKHYFDIITAAIRTSKLVFADLIQHSVPVECKAHLILYCGILATLSFKMYIFCY